MFCNLCADVVWMHARQHPGSHLVMRIPAGSSPNTEDIQYAKQLPFKSPCCRVLCLAPSASALSSSLAVHTSENACYPRGWHEAILQRLGEYVCFPQKLFPLSLAVVLRQTHSCRYPFWVGFAVVGGVLLNMQSKFTGKQIFALCGSQCDRRIQQCAS